MRALSLWLLFGLASGLMTENPIPNGEHPHCTLDGSVEHVGSDVTGMTRTSNFYTVASRENTSNEYVFNVCGALGPNYRPHDTRVTPMLIRKPVSAVNPEKFFSVSKVFGYWTAPQVQDAVTDGLDGRFTWQQYGVSPDVSQVRTKYMLYGAAPYNATIKLNCATVDFVDIDGETETNSSVDITVYSPRACGVVPRGGGATHERTMLQTEIYVLIGCFSVVLVYIILGYTWNKFRGDGESKVPHSDCLFGCPGLVRDGCVYTREMVSFKSSNGWGADGAYNLLDVPMDSTASHPGSPPLGCQPL